MRREIVTIGLVLVPLLAAYFRRQLDTALLRDTLAAEAPFVDQLGLDRSFLG